MICFIDMNTDKLTPTSGINLDLL